MVESANQRGWYFDGSADYLQLDASDPDCDKFSPSQQNDDFTVFVKIIPYDNTRHQGVIGRYNTDAGNYRSWLIYLVYTLGYSPRALVSKNGLAAGGEGVDYSTAILTDMLDGQPLLLCMRYKYVTDGTSILKLRGKTDTADTEDVNNSAVGPVYHPGANADFQLFNWQAGATRKMMGKGIMVAYFNRYCSDSEVDEVFDGTKEPQELSGCEMQSGFDDLTIGATYTSEYGNITFDVYGSPEGSGNVVEGYNVNLDEGELEPAAAAAASPGIASVDVIDEYTVKVNFGVPAVDNAALRSIENYVIDPEMTISAVTPESAANPSYVLLTMNEQTTGRNYDVTLYRIVKA